MDNVLAIASGVIFVVGAAWFAIVLFRLDPLMKEHQREAGVKWYQMLKVSQVTDKAFRNDPEVRRLYQQALLTFLVSLGALLLAIQITGWRPLSR